MKNLMDKNMENRMETSFYRACFGRCIPFLSFGPGFGAKGLGLGSDSRFLYWSKYLSSIIGLLS